MKLFLLITSICQLATPGILALIGGDFASTNDPQITPADYAFIIWGLITLMAFIGSIYIVRSPIKVGGIERVYQSLSIVYLGFILWIVAALYQYLAVTVLIFIVMFSYLYQVLRYLEAHYEKLFLSLKIWLYGGVSIYAGWTSVAIWANLASALKYYGLSDSGEIGIIWQGAILIGALLTALYSSYHFRGNLVYSFTVLWAFIGVLMGLREIADTQILQAITLCAIGIFITITLIIRSSRLTKLLFTR